MPTYDYTDDTVKTTLGGDKSGEATERRCSHCGLAVPPELDACPNDGTPMTASVQELLSGRYEFMDVVGKGGMSIIYRARHRLMNNVVAIKLLHEKLTHEKSAFKRFQLESQATSRLDHPNVIKVHDFGILDHGYTYLVMDYIVGRSLSEVIDKEGKLEPSRALNLFKQTCEGLSHAHANGVLHRDLKPSNLLVTGEGQTERIKIVDFGIAKVLSPDGDEGNKLTSTGEVFGSPLYMSPEQCMGQEINGRSDIYSMGCLMYEALTGRPPHIGSNPLETIFKQANEEAEPFAAGLKHPAADQISRMVLRALEKDPAHRYQSADELLADIQRVLAGHEVTASTKPRPKPVIAGSICALIVLTISLWALKANIDFADSASKKKQKDELLMKLAAAPDASKINLAYADLDDDQCKLLAASKNVWFLNIRGNPKITTRGITHFVADPLIEELLLDGTSVDNSVIAEAQKLPRLHRFTVGNTAITSDCFPQLANITLLRELWLNDLGLNDDDISKLPKLENLRVLKLDDNPQITDKGFSMVMAKCPNLNWLTIRGLTSITDAVVPLVKPSQFKTFAIARTNLTDAGVKSLLPHKVTRKAYINEGSKAEMANHALKMLAK